MHTIFGHYQACHSLKFRLFECSERQIVMASVKSFYGKRTQHRFLPDAVNQIQDDDLESADVVIMGPPTGGQDS